MSPPTLPAQDPLMDLFQPHRPLPTRTSVLDPISETAPETDLADRRPRRGLLFERSISVPISQFASRYLDEDDSSSDEDDSSSDDEDSSCDDEDKAEQQIMQRLVRRSNSLDTIATYNSNTSNKSTPVTPHVPSTVSLRQRMRPSIKSLLFKRIVKIAPLRRCKSN